MLFITLTYGGFVYLVFFRFKLLPWNKLTQFLTLVVGLVLVSAFLVGYSNLTPSSSQAVVMGRMVEIAPQVPGQVISVDVEQNERVAKGDILFRIDPTIFEAQVKELEATIALSRLRLGQFKELAQIDAASLFQIEQTEATIEQLEARLKGARFNLENTTVRAPYAGLVPKLLLKPGVQVSPARAVMTFVDTEELEIFAKVPQKGLQTMKVGDPVVLNFPAVPGRLFDAEVTAIPSAIAEGQFLATGQLDSVQQRRMVRLYPVFISLPDDFPKNLLRLGLAVNCTIMTENAGPIGIYAIAMQWVATSLDALL
jgi:RND family efflux transporter MFP subunit